MKERASEWVSDCMSLYMWCSSLKLQILLIIQSHTHIWTYIVYKCNHMYALLALLLLHVVCLLRVKMLIVATHLCVVVIYVHTFFRCKRHRSLFMYLQSAVLSLSRTHTHTLNFNVLVILYTAPYDQPTDRLQYKLLLCCFCCCYFFSLHLVLLLSVNLWETILDCILETEMDSTHNYHYIHTPHTYLLVYICYWLLYI